MNGMHWSENENYVNELWYVLAVFFAPAALVAAIVMCVSGNVAKGVKVGGLALVVMVGVLIAFG